MATLELNDIKIIVKKYEQAQDCDILDFQLVPLGEDVSGFMGEHLILKIEYKIDNGPIRKAQFFAKRCPDGYSKYSDIIGQAFMKEHFFFQTLLELYGKHYSYNSKTFDSSLAAKYYFSKTNIIVVEDLSSQGYTVPNMPYLDRDHLNMLTKTIAKLHAESLFYEESETKKRGKPYLLLDDYEKIFIEPLFQGPEGLTSLWGFFTTGVRCVSPLIDEKYGTNKHEAEKLKIFCNTLANQMSEAFKSNRLGERNVACHGDIWIKNTMFLYNDKGIPIHCKLVDFQAIRYGPPAYDAMLPFFVAVDRSFRQKYLNDYQKFYYHCLTEELDYLDLSIASLLPLQEFEDTCNYHLPYLVAVKMIYYTIMRTDPERLKEINENSEDLAHFVFKDRSSIAVKSYKEDANYRGFMDDLLEDLYEVFKGCDKNKIKLVN